MRSHHPDQPKLPKAAEEEQCDGPYVDAIQAALAWLSGPKKLSKFQMLQAGFTRSSLDILEKHGMIVRTTCPNGIVYYASSNATKYT